jgi:hypothetical protein
MVYQFRPEFGRWRRRRGGFTKIRTIPMAFSGLATLPKEPPANDSAASKLRGLKNENTDHLLIAVTP